MAVINSYNYQKPKNFVKQPPLQIVADEPSNSVARVSKPNSKIDQYLESKIMSAKPEELTYMLYEGLVKFIKKSIMYLEEDNFQEVNYNAQRAQAIIDELRSTLNFEVPLSKNLDSLYEYISYKVMNANINKSENEFKEALELAEEFKDTWRQAFGIKL